MRRRVAMSSRARVLHAEAMPLILLCRRGLNLRRPSCPPARFRFACMIMQDSGDNTVSSKRSVCPIACSVLLFTFGQPAIADNFKRLEPIGKLRIDWTRTAFTMMRAFGTAEQLDVIMFERLGPSDNFGLTVIRNEVRFHGQGSRF
jgi:hypothetical protein